MRRPTLVLLLAAACSPAASPPTVPPVTTAAATVPLAVEAAPPGPLVVAGTMNATSPGPALPPAPVVADPCRGMVFDLAALPDCATHHPTDPPSQTSKLAVSLVPDSPRMPAGAIQGVSVVFTNKSSEALPVDVHSGCSLFELGAYDAAGVRKDLVIGSCGRGGGCGGSVLRLVVEPGGTLTRHMTFKAEVTRVMPAQDCRDVDAGGLPPGKYQLRATAMQANWLIGGPKNPPSISVPLEVTP
jgi:hypothetical protein